MPNGERKSLDSIVDRWAQKFPDYEACRSSGRSSECSKFTFADLQRESIRVAGILQSRLTELDPEPTSKRPVGICMKRDHRWYICYIALIRLGVPIVPLTQDIKDRGAQDERNSKIMSDLNPIIILTNDTTPVAIIKQMVTMQVHFIDPLDECHQTLQRMRDISKIPLAYLFTGGTTSASKCVQISHDMAMHEIDGYPAIVPSLTATRGRQEIILQHSSTYWGATFLGQINIALAFGACIVFHEDQSIDLTDVIERHGVTVLGVVPSQLAAISGACKSLRTVFTWGEKLEADSARQWTDRCEIIELLVSTEYWLCLYSKNGSSDFEILNSPNVDIRTIKRDRRGEVLVIGGACVTPFGYFEEHHNRAVFIEQDGNKFFKSNDIVFWTEFGRKLRFIGRSDQLIKIGGEWRDLCVLELRIREEMKIDAVVLGDSPVGPVVFVAPRKSTKFIFQKLKKIFIDQYFKIFLVSEIPRNSVTGKVDRRVLLDHIAAKMDNPNQSEAVRNRRKKFSTKFFLVFLTILNFIACIPSLLARAVLVPYICLLLLSVETSTGIGWFRRVTSQYHTWMRKIPSSHLNVSVLLSCILPIWTSTALACLAVFRMGRFLSWPVCFWIGSIRQILGILSPASPRHQKRTSPYSSNKPASVVTPRGWVDENTPNTLKCDKVVGVCDFEAYEIFQQVRGNSAELVEEKSEDGDDSTDAEDAVDLVTGSIIMILKDACTCGLSSMTSLEAVIVANKLGEKFSCRVSVRDVLKCESVGDLVALIKGAAGVERDLPSKHSYPFPTHRRCQIWGWGLPCIWMFELVSPPDSRYPWIHYKSLQKAFEILCDRHEALRAVPADPLVYGYWMNQVFESFDVLRSSWWPVSVLWKLLGQLISHACARISTTHHKPYIKWNRNQSFKSIEEIRSYITSQRFRPPVDCEILTLCDSGERSFLKISITHAFSDGSSVVPILRDLNSLYSAIVLGENLPLLPPAPSGLMVQESRLVNALTRMPHGPEDLYLSYNMDTAMGIDGSGFTRTVLLERSLILLAQSAAVRLACPLDVLFLATISCALVSWNWQNKGAWDQWLSLSLIVPLRDSPEGAGDCVGFLADIRNVEIFFGSNPHLCTYRSILESVHAIRRSRDWKIPIPLSSCERPLINIVPATKHAVPFCQDMIVLQPESARCTVNRPMEVYIEQIGEENWILRGICRYADFENGEDSFYELVDFFRNSVIRFASAPDSPMSVK